MDPVRPRFHTHLPALLFLVLGALGLAGLAPAARAEVMRSFDATIQVNPDASFNVVETIHMDFQGEQRHGIFRMVPWRFRRGGKTVKIGLDSITVTDERGRPIPFQSTSEGAYRRIRIGDPDRTISGEQTYRIRYTVRRAMPAFNGRPEVYWNVTGNEWPYPILQSTARVYPPSGTSVKDVQIRSFRGVKGSKVGATMARKADHILFQTGGLGPGEGLTVVASLPPGSVSESSADRTNRVLDSPWLGALFPLLTLALMGRLWWTGGRDADSGKPAAIEWDPPTDLSPAEVGALVDESCDMEDILSTVVDLAVRGYLRIEEHETKTFLFFSNKDYIFTRLPPPANDTLAPHEAVFLKGMFGSILGGVETVALSDLKNKFYTNLPQIRSAIYESLTKKGLFTSNPNTTRNSYLVGGLFLAGIAGVSLFIVPGEMLPLRIGLVVAGALIALFSRAMPAKTPAGSAMLRQALGFQRFVRLTEKDRIAVLAKDDPTLFGRLLPYAMVLGVADQWADAFKDLLREPPEWYSSPSYGYGRPFYANAFINDLGSGMKSMGSAFASAPSSSGGSGMGGGGSSGGGFGGGGGGSW